MVSELSEIFDLKFSGLGGEVEFLDSVFVVLRERSPNFLTGPLALKQINYVVNKHLKEVISQKEKATARKVDDEVQEIKSPSILAEERAEAETSPSTVADKIEATEDVEHDEDEGGSAPIGNGGSTDRYTWTQTLSEVTIAVKLQCSIRSKEISCNITRTGLEVQLANCKEPLIKGLFPHKINSEDSTWTIESDQGSKMLVIYLPKVEGMNWWDCAIQGDEKINTRKIVPENSKLDDLDGETRQTVEKMMFDQRMKAMGKPTSEERRKNEMLQKFMAQHPEMDFSNAKIM